MTPFENIERSTTLADPADRAKPRHLGASLEMLISSLLGLIASLVLSIDAIVLAADPFTDLSCDLSAKVSCTTVGLSWQANLLGFPNAYLGLMTEPVVITIAVAMLAGVRFPRWFMIAAQVVYAIGFGFAVWLFLQAYFVIGALCPWCLLITVTTTLVFASMTRINLLDNNLGLSERAHARTAMWLRRGADIWVVVILLAILAAMVLARYV